LFNPHIGENLVPFPGLEFLRVQRRIIRPLDGVIDVGEQAIMADSSWMVSINPRI